MIAKPGATEATGSERTETRRVGGELAVAVRPQPRRRGPVPAEHVVHRVRGRVAGRAIVQGLATHVLRHWEDEGLLTPAERVKGRRYYHESHAARITMILRGKDMGLSLTQIAEIVSEPIARAAAPPVPASS